MNNFVAKFEQTDLPILSIRDADNVIWILAQPFGRLLRYSNVRKAIIDHVSPANRKSSHEFGRLTANLPKTYNVQFNSTFINEAGLFQLIRGSRMPNAVRFKQWVDDELLIQLYRRGSYDMRDAPPVARDAMSAVSVAAGTSGYSNQSNIDLQTQLVIKDLQLQLQESQKREVESRLETEKALRIVEQVKRDRTLVSLHMGAHGLLAKDVIDENAELRQRLERNVARVAPNMEDHPQKQSHIALYITEEAEKTPLFRVTRCQLERIESNERAKRRVQVYPADALHQPRASAWIYKAELVYKKPCPNAVELWNLVKRANPHFFYGVIFSNSNNMEFRTLTGAQLADKYKEDWDRYESDETGDDYFRRCFDKLDLRNVNDALDKCFTPADEACSRIVQMIERAAQRAVADCRPPAGPSRSLDDLSAYSTEESMRYVRNYRPNDVFSSSHRATSSYASSNGSLTPNEDLLFDRNRIPDD